MKKNSSNYISFSPPTITDEDINAVVSVLKSGWITTGPKVQEFEKKLMEITKAGGVKCVNSATASMEIILRTLGITKNDEVITTPYTFTASASVIHHVGAKIVLADTLKDSFNISPLEIEKKITKNTKAIITVDFAGIPCDYDKIYRVLKSKKTLYTPKNSTFQTMFDHPPVISDASHSFGAKYKKIPVGSITEFTAFSFHAVKNITTAEGGAILIKNSLPDNIINNLLNAFRLYSLHGQSKDAFKRFASNWEYDIMVPGFKVNMTDIQAALGISQLARFNNIYNIRKNYFERYYDNLKDNNNFILPVFNNKIIDNAYHLFPVRIKGYNEIKRNALIDILNKNGIPVNVHFKPLPLFTAYKKLHFNIKDYPNAYRNYENVITLPLHLELRIKDIDYICKTLINCIESVN